MTLRRGQPLGTLRRGHALGGARFRRPGRRFRFASPFLEVGAAMAVFSTVSSALPAQSGDAADDVSDTGRADYRIEARLEEGKILEGELELTWTNLSGESVDDLWFHLYLNAFSNNRSTHLTEAKGKLGDVEVEDGWGWSEVRSVEVAGLGDGGYTDVFPSFQYRRPDDGRDDDRTVFSVDLPREVESGSSVTVRITWRSQLPRVRRRTGYKGDFLLVAQWFPKLGVYEAGRGWNCHQFHMNSEFYSDYGTYDVTLDLPAEYSGKVWGSGVKTNDSQPKGRLLVTFAAPSPDDRRRRDNFGKSPLVHDFTWTADPRFEVHHRIFSFSEWAERYEGEVERARQAFGPDEELECRNVDVTILIHPERRSQVERHFKATSAALFFYGLWFGEYPYEHVTVVDPAWGAGAAGGMEYPTLFTCGTSLFTTEDMYRPESVTVHECGHQFWYGLVGNNEFEAAWLDEGLNSYTDSEVLARVYGPRRGTTSFVDIPVDGVPVADLVGYDESTKKVEGLLGRELTIPLPIVPDLVLDPIPRSGFLELWRQQPRLTFVPEWTDPRQSDRRGYLRSPDADPLETSAWEHADRASYRANSYPRTAVALRSLPGVIGYDAFLKGMRNYAREWRYRHPYPKDFYASFQAGAGVEVDWYFRELFQGTGTGDWSVSVTQKRRPLPIGFFQSEGGGFLERPEDPDAAADEEPWNAEVLLRRKGELRLPMPVRLTYADGTVEELVWTREEQGEKTWRRLERGGQAELVSVVIDPERSFHLDSDLSNNQWHAEKDDLAPARWGERVLAQYQRYLHWIAGIGG